MAYIDPTAASVKVRYPEFAAIANTLIDLFIAEAKLWVDTSWLEGDYTIAVQTLTAHMMAAEGLLSGLSGPIATTGLVQSERLGDASITYATMHAGAWSVAESWFASTPYGLKFLALRRRNFPAVAWT